MAPIVARLGQVFLGLLFFHTLPWGSPTCWYRGPWQIAERLEASAWAAVKWEAMCVPVVCAVLQPGCQVPGCYLGGG